MAGETHASAPARQRRRRKRRARSAPPSPPPRASRVRRDRRRAIAIAGASTLATLVLVALGIYVGFGRRAPDAGEGGRVEIDWPSATTTQGAAELLAEASLTDSAEAMAVFLRATGGTDGFIPGPHLLPRGASPWEIRRLLSRAPGRPTVKVVIPEGFNRFDIAGRLHAAGVAGKQAFLAATADAALLDELGIERRAAGADTAEGFLFPATYELALDTDPRDIVRRLVEEFDRRWRALAAQHDDGLASVAAPPLGWTRRDVVTLASMVEKEAVADEERPLVASVFYNRLLDPSFRPKRLQSDPTSAYGCLVRPASPGCASFSGKPTHATNHDPENPYSTYVHEGLPPGPIANPGARSLQAALAPATTRYFYFVAKGGGRHTFSETLGAHNEAVRAAR